MAGLWVLNAQASSPPPPTSRPPVVQPTSSPTPFHPSQLPLPSSPISTLILRGLPPHPRLHVLQLSQPSLPRVSRQHLPSMYLIVELVIHCPVRPLQDSEPHESRLTLGLAHGNFSKRGFSAPRPLPPRLQPGGGVRTVGTQVPVAGVRCTARQPEARASYSPRRSLSRQSVRASQALRLYHFGFGYVIIERQLRRQSLAAAFASTRTARGRGAEVRARAAGSARSPDCQEGPGHAPRAFWREARGGPDNENVRRLSQ